MGFFHEHIILPMSDLATGQRVHYWLQFLKHSAHWDEAQMRSFQDERFRLLIRHASTHVPFYRELFSNNGWHTEDFQTIDDLQQLPVVSKAIMRKEGIMRFMADNIPQKERMVAHSSGSTGEPFEFYVSKEAYSLNTATKLRTWYDIGYRLGDSYFKISSSPRVSRIKKLQDRLSNGQCIPFNSLDDNSLHQILTLIEKKHPSVIRTHPNAIYYLARYRQKHPNFFSYNPRYILTTSANLPDTFRSTIRDVFRCDVIDAYSCEGTANCAENAKHDGYHISQEYGIIEVLDSNGNTVQEGRGKVVSTDLWNMAMPFIRYDTQDFVNLDGNRIITRILGRECELLEAPNGHRYTGQVIDDFFSYQTHHSVEAFQVVRHHSPDRVLFRIIVNGNYSSDVEESIIRHWQRELEMPVTIETVEHIPLMHNNKYLTIIEE